MQALAKECRVQDLNPGPLSPKPTQLTTRAAKWSIDRDLLAKFEGVPLLHESDVEGALILQDRVQVLVDDEADVVDVAAPDGVHELPEVLGVRFDIQTRLSLQICKDGSLNPYKISDHITFFLS